ncbi:uncharacterized protein LOC134210731 [Armigeres subalbatus]|uniref:uncharacterized protein LOC134210731 n=1 Tax=Armigeres subalbatus TaxID=124917 RepID=UPI002ED03968
MINESQAMIKSSTIESLLVDHNLEQGKTHPLDFPLKNDVLQTNRDCQSSRSSWKTPRTLLRLGQIATSIVIIVLTISYPQPTTRSLIHLALSALIGTLILLGDSVIEAHPLRRGFTPVLWFKVELWYTAMVAVAFHALTIVLLVDGIRWDRFNVYHLMVAFGLVNEVMYLADWWTNFNNLQEIFNNLNKEQHNAVQQEAIN